MVANQHEKITGYRDLTQGEIDLMNEGKELAEKVGEYIEKLDTMSRPENIEGYVDGRWLAIGRTQLQQGFMAAIRSIAKPTTF